MFSKIYFILNKIIRYKVFFFFFVARQLRYSWKSGEDIYYTF